MKRIFMNPILIYFFLLSSSFAFAQAYQNPSEKYLDAYKKYEDAACPVTSGSISNFVYFSRDRAAIIDHPFLTHPAFNGAQIMYTWKELEPGKDEYDFSKIEEDMQYLHAFGKKLFMDGCPRAFLAPSTICILFSLVDALRTLVPSSTFCGRTCGIICDFENQLLGMICKRNHEA